MSTQDALHQDVLMVGQRICSYISNHSFSVTTASVSMTAEQNHVLSDPAYNGEQTI